MAADASIWLAIGLALYLIGAAAVVALCLKALRQGAEFEGEIKALSLCLKFHIRPPGKTSDIGSRCPTCGKTTTSASNAHAPVKEIPVK
jgi:hypothetical protein